MSVKTEQVFNSVETRSKLTLPRLHLDTAGLSPKGSVAYNLPDDAVYVSDGEEWKKINGDGGDATFNNVQITNLTVLSTLVSNNNLFTNLTVLSTLRGHDTVIDRLTVLTSLNSLGPLVISDDTPSTSCTTGALTVAGGTGIEGDLWVCGTVNVNTGDAGGVLKLQSAGTSGTLRLLAQDPSGASRTLTVPAATDTIVARATSDTFTNKTITDPTNNVIARGLRSATTNVDVSAATAPTSGQILTATSGTAATWQTLSIPTSILESGTYTPTASSASGTLSAMTNLSGRYIKVGTLVHLGVTGQITVTNGTGSIDLTVPKTLNESIGAFTTSIVQTVDSGALGLAIETNSGTNRIILRVVCGAANATLYVAINGLYITT